MENYLFNVFFFVFFFFSSCDSKFAVNVELSQPVANIGDDLTVTCHVKNTEAKSFFILWVKRIGGEEVEIGTNHHINKEFGATGRFDASFKVIEDDSTNVLFTLVINNVQSADSGEIGCRIPSGNIMILEDFTVLVPLKSIEMKSYKVNNSFGQTFENNENVTFTENEMTRFLCLVNGSYPEPKVSVTIGGKDITSMFNKESKLIKDGSTPGLQKLYYGVTMEKNNLPIGFEFTNKRFECRATLDQISSEKSLGINIKLTGYKPKFLCGNKVIGELHTKKFNLTCRVMSDPPMKDFQIYWNNMPPGKIDDDEQPHGNISLHDRQRDGRYYAALNEGASKNEHFMVLTIDRLFTQHLRKYYFEATNNLGKTVHEVRLMQDDYGEVTGRGSIACFSSITNLLLIILLFSGIFL